MPPVPRGERISEAPSRVPGVRDIDRETSRDHIVSRVFVRFRKPAHRATRSAPGLHIQPCVRQAGDDLSGERFAVRQQLESGKLEPGADRAADERVGSGRSCGLPAIGGYTADRRLVLVTAWAQAKSLQALLVGRQHQQLQRRAFIVMPDLIGSHPMPAVHRACGEQKIDGRQRRSVAAFVGRDEDVRLEHLPVLASFGIRHESERLDELCHTRVHSLFLLPPRFPDSSPHESRGRGDRDWAVGSAYTHRRRLPHASRVDGSGAASPRLVNPQRRQM